MAQIKPASKMTPAKKKQLVMIGGGAGAIVLLSLVAGLMVQSSRDKSNTAEEPSEKPINLSLPTPGAQLSDSDVWRANESAKIEALSKELREMRDRSGDAQIRNMMPSGVHGNMTGAAGDMPLPPPPPPPGMWSPANGQVRGVPGQEQTEQQAGTGQAPVEPPVRRAFALEVPGSKAGATTAPVETTRSATEPQAQDAPTAETYLPAGSFLRVALLSGLDAPTGGQAQNNPHPVLMRVLEPAQLPNRFKSDMSDCVVTGNGYGDISSERAYIRLDRLSCVRRDGGSVDVPLKGYIAGEDGKAGMRGRLVSKQGQALANAFLAGVGSGIGQAFRDSSTTQSTSALGTTSTVTQGKELEAGLGAGVGSAMSQLSKYYIRLAEQIFPVIEIDGGRVVDVVVTRGTTLEMDKGRNRR